ncbi:MAG: SprT family zinc-dependent metalloprotease [Candidatus Theseobacter exili]|nr:SprT family zinc-dependent metalloprotease [Candidatus Theseobacter exili]
MNRLFLICNTLFNKHKDFQIPYVLKESKKARNVLLKISLKDGLTVTVPRGYNKRFIRSILLKKRIWIERKLEEVKVQRKLMQIENKEHLPDRILLKAINEEWVVSYQHDNNDRFLVLENSPGFLVLTGQVDNKEESKKALRKWVRNKAINHFVPWIRRVSEENGLPFERVSVRNQCSRWGSCSAKKNISINQRLLFVPDYLVRYVFVHELCHTIAPDHSSRFWSLVEQKEPDYKKMNSELRNAWKTLPLWMVG